LWSPNNFRVRIETYTYWLKEVKGLMRIEFTPISKEEIVAILKGEKPAGEG
jgi:hypothetical protein